MHTYRDSADLDSRIMHGKEFSVGYFKPAYSDGLPAEFYALSKHGSEVQAIQRVNALNGGDGSPYLHQ
jgi:hypothetical protein